MNIWITLDCLIIYMKIRIANSIVLILFLSLLSVFRCKRTNTENIYLNLNCYIKNCIDSILIINYGLFDVYHPTLKDKVLFLANNEIRYDTLEVIGSIETRKNDKLIENELKYLFYKFANWGNDSIYVILNHESKEVSQYLFHYIKEEKADVHEIKPELFDLNEYKLNIKFVKNDKLKLYEYNRPILVFSKMYYIANLNEENFIFNIYKEGQSHIKFLIISNRTVGNKCGVIESKSVD